jgi:hypothetical protein
MLPLRRPGKRLRQPMRTADLIGTQWDSTKSLNLGLIEIAFLAFPL